MLPYPSCSVSFLYWLHLVIRSYSSDAGAVSLLLGEAFWGGERYGGWHGGGGGGGEGARALVVALSREYSGGGGALLRASATLVYTLRLTHTPATPHASYHSRALYKLTILIPRPQHASV